MSNETVILVHGLWVNGLEMTWFRHCLQEAGYTTERFHYHSVNSTPFENAMELNGMLEGVEAGTVHFVCHSLGGLVVRHLFHHFPGQRPGRIVTLGTPHNGSHSARGLSRFLAGRLLLGRSLQHGLLGPVPPWTAMNKLGSIAGTTRLGLGLLIPGLPQPSDGTVSVEETRFEGMTDHIELAVTHTSMLYSEEVLMQTCHFLQNGQFNHNY